MTNISGSMVWIGLAAFALVLLLDCALVAGYLTRNKRTGRPFLAERWSLADLWLALQAIVVVLIVTVLPIFFVAMAKGITLNEMTTFDTRRAMLWVLLPSIVVQDIVLFLIPAAVVNLRYRLPLRAIGLPRLPRRRDVFAGIALGLIAMGISVGVAAGVDAVAAHFTHVAWVRAAIHTDETNTVADIAKKLPSFGLGGLLLAIVGAGIAAPFGEEMLFRGLAFRTLKQRLGLWPGIVGSALLFTLPHGYGLGLIPVFVLGMILAWVYNTSGSLWITILMHATNNTVQVVLAYALPAHK